MNDTTKGYVFAFSYVLCAVVTYFGLEFVYRAYPEVGAPQAIMYGFIGAVLIFSPWYFSKKSNREAFVPTIQNYGWLAVSVSVLTSAGAFLWFFTVFSSNSGIVSLLGNAQILFSILLGLFLLKERISPLQGMGILACIAGIFLVGTLKGEIELWVFALFMFGNILYAIQSFLFKKFGTRTHIISFTYLRAIIITCIIFFVFLILGEVRLIPFYAVLLVGISQLFGFLIARVFYFTAHKYLPISHLHTAAFSEPVLVITMGAIVFQHSITTQKIVGGLLIIGGLALFIFAKKTIKAIS